VSKTSHPKIYYSWWESWYNIWGLGWNK